MFEFILKKMCLLIPFSTIRRKIRVRIGLLKFLPSKFRIIKKAKYVGKNLCVGGYSYVNSKTVIKDNVVFNGIQIRGDGSVEIGNYFTSGIECMILTQSHDYNHGTQIPYDSKNYIYKPVVIKDFVWIGSRVTILPGTFIEEGAIIQAGSVVHGRIPKYAVAGGNPAKVFKYRDIEHYEKLKAEKSFYKHLP